MSDTQFIASTFRPEIARVADKLYGVTHKNRASYIDVVSKEQALDFIEDDELVEVTPKEIRLRKKHLTENERKRAGRAG